MFTHAVVLRRTSFDCSPRSCLRVWDDPTPPTPPIFKLYLTCMRAWSWVCMLACTRVSHRAYDSMQIPCTVCNRGLHRTTFGQSPQNTHSSAASGDFHVQRNSHFISSTSALSRTLRSREQVCINDYGTERPRCAPSIGTINISADTGSLVPVLGQLFFFVFRFWTQNLSRSVGAKELPLLEVLVNIQ